MSLRFDPPDGDGVRRRRRHTLQRPPSSTPRLYEQDGKGDDAMVHAHYFIGSCDWWITEYDVDDDRAFGWCDLGMGFPELGYVSLAELASVSVPVQVRPSIPDHGVVQTFPVRVEYDEHWTPRTLREVKAQRT